jgi:signal transduction histidine kinase
VKEHFWLPPEAEVTIDEFFAQLHPEDRERTRQAIATSIEERRPYNIQYRTVGPEGQVRWIRAIGRAFYDALGQPRRFDGVTLDVTEAKLSNDVLAMAKEEAEKANRAKDHFLAALSHELRTPLAPVLMTAGALRNDERLPGDLRAELAMIERNIALEARLIDDLLDLTRIGKGKLSLQRQWCDLHSLIALAVEIVRDEAAAKGLHIDLALEATHSGAMVDPARLQQVIWNLLRNSVKFTPANGHITVRTENIGAAENRTLRLEVQDTGIGIDPSALERIFAPFEQEEATRTGNFGGLGLGLAIARAIAELHQGRIHAESEGANRGARFIVELPGAAEAPAGSSAASGEGSETATTVFVPQVPLRLLLVEDNDTTLRVLSRLLERVGHRVTTARTCAEARAAAAETTFDAVISDLGLPDGTGTDLMAALRDRHGLRGVALSGYGMEEDIARALQAGFAAHLVKPVDFRQLCYALGRLWETKG